MCSAQGAGEESYSLHETRVAKKHARPKAPRHAREAVIGRHDDGRVGPQTRIARRPQQAAELAVRYFNEQREMADKGKLGKAAFKCGPAENARAWKALVDEFFAGRDLVPSC